MRLRRWSSHRPVNAAPEQGAAIRQAISGNGFERHARSRLCEA
jgi:hypothetical protein